MRPTRSLSRCHLPTLSLLLLAACTDAGGVDAGIAPDGAIPDGGNANQDATHTDPGVEVTPARSAADDQAFAALAQKAAAIGQLDAAGLEAAYPVKFGPALGYDPNAVGFMDLIQDSALALSDGERTLLGRQGFMISTRREFPTFLRGLAEIYSEDLPVYVTADALLESVHSSYDTILQAVERVMLVPELKALLTGMRSRLQALDPGAPARTDADLYLAVALSLLDGKPAAPVAGADATKIAAIVAKALAAVGTETVTLFAVMREEDFSQFKPRGHYTGDATLEQYFRAQMWLGRVDLRLLETLADGSQVFRRPQYLAMLLFDALVGADRPRFERIDNAIRTFVGESDYMVLSEVQKLVADLGGEAAARTASDQKVVDAIIKGGYGKQQIASHLMVNGGVVDSLPLNCSFALLGQRYVVDSHVFSEVVYDRLHQKRMLPTPLDAAFAALGNAQALTIHPELSKFSELPGALGRMRVLVDSHDDTFWSANFYNLWLRALRALSPAADLTSVAGLPAVAKTEAWGLRMLNAQLGSWAELRHDTVLYAKQSYTGIPVCEYPDAYVDPYPEFYRALHDYALAGSRMAELMLDVAPTEALPIESYFALLASATTQLGDMAERELRGEPFSAEQMAFINDAVRIDHESAGCTTIDVPNGWYARLFYEPSKSIEFDPTVADVHTQPADETGNPVGKVLHVGTGYPRLMVTTVDTCMGPRAYAGVVYAYHEKITTAFKRLTDEEWAAGLRGGPRPEDVAWLSSVLAK